MLARKFGHERLEHCGAAHARHLVRGHRDTQARSAHDDSALRLARCDRCADDIAELRIVHGRLVAGAVVENGVTLTAQHLRNAIFYFEACVIGGDGDYHRSAFHTLNG